MRYHKPVFTPNVEAATAAYHEAYARWIGTFEIVEGIGREGSLPHWNYEAREQAWNFYVIARNNWIAAHSVKKK